MNDLFAPMVKQRIKNGEWWIGDCLELMKDIPDGSVDMVLCDLPYGTTQNKWDTVIPFEPLWREYWRVCKSNAAILLTAQCPFDKMLGASQIDHLKYEWIWEKSRPTGHLNAKKQPMKSHENVLVFYRKQCVYNPEMWLGEANHVSGKPHVKSASKNYGKADKIIIEQPDGIKYPKSIQQFTSLSPTSGIIHSTQKPVALFEYLIKTYTNKGDLILDNTAGSGTTAVAAENMSRRWICIERDPEYSRLAKQRIQNNQPEGTDT